MEENSPGNRHRCPVPGPELRLCAAGAPGQDCEPERHLRLCGHVARDERVEQGAPGQPYVLDRLYVWRHAHHGHFHPERGRLHGAAVQAAVCGQAPGHVDFRDPSGCLPAVSGAGRELARGRGWSHCRGLLQLQLPDYPGGPQHQDAGHRPHALGAGRPGVHLPGSLRAGKGLCLARRASGRRPLRPHPQLPDQGQPPADFLLPGHRRAHLCHRGTGAYHPDQGLEAVHRGIGPAAGAGRRRHRHQCEQAAAAGQIHPQHHARRLRAFQGRRQRQGPGPGLCHFLELWLGGASQPHDSQFQRRVIGRGGGSGEIGHHPTAETGGAKEPQGDGQEPAHVLGPPALYRRPHVYGCHYGVPFCAGPVPVQGAEQMVDHSGHPPRRPHGGRQSFHALYRLLLQVFTAL